MGKGRKVGKDGGWERGEPLQELGRGRPGRGRELTAIPPRIRIQILAHLREILARLLEPRREDAEGVVALEAKNEDDDFPAPSATFVTTVGLLATAGVAAVGPGRDGGDFVIDDAGHGGVCAQAEGDGGLVEEFEGEEDGGDG